MRNWKDLGEVPDSDDESLESFDSVRESQDEIAEHPVEPIASIREVPGHDELDEIWEIPPSSAEPTCPRETGKGGELSAITRSPPSSPLSPPPDDDDDLDELGLLPTGPPAVKKYEPRYFTPAPPAGKVAAPFEEDEISVPHVIIAAPSAHRTTSTAVLAADTSAVASPSPQGTKASLAVEAALPGPRGSSQQQHDLELVRAYAREERSLRPRKPIQQHPYLLESAQYAHVMKSHGVKPIRVALELRDIRERQDGRESQDREFEADEESQDRDDSGPKVSTDESQPILFDDTDDEQDGAALSTSPPRRSSPRHLLQTSSQQTDDSLTDNTSILGDEFPPVAELLRQGREKPASRTLKRQLSVRSIPVNKRVRSLATSPIDVLSPPVCRPQDVWDAPLSLDSEGVHDPSQDLGNTPRSLLYHPVKTPIMRRPSLAGGSSFGSPEVPVVDLTSRVEEDENEASEAETASTTSDSESGSEVVRHNVKRIRGVLPASWLRLDQQKGGRTRQKDERDRHSSPGRALPRRGVALPKATASSPKPSAAPLFFSDESDDNEVTTTRPQEARRGRSLSHEREAIPMAIWSDYDDAGSVVEEDHIDRMYTGPKRKRTAHGISSVPKRRKTSLQNRFDGQKTYQPRINEALDRSNGKPSTTHRTLSTGKPRRVGGQKPSHARRHGKRAATPPLLSILDVLEPQAPPFLKIAARTAKKRQNLGKSSPSHKQIDFGTRKDNVDARSVLRDWKAGRIRPKVANPSSKKPARRQPLQGLSLNHLSSPTPPNGNRRVRRQSTGLGSQDAGNVAVDDLENRQGTRQRGRKATSGVRAQSWSARPAQLETEDNEPQDRAGFVARKRILDALYRRARKTGSNLSVRLDQLWDPAVQTSPPPGAVTPLDRSANKEQPAPTAHTRNNTKSRFRKRFVPRSIDLQAPHYRHANDPILVDDDTAIQAREEPCQEDKLSGLGPYGTKYTYHFEIFPLDRGVFFHGTTIIGSGWVNKIVDASYPDSTRQVRPRASFSMDGNALRWGAWDDTTSSEMGILVDWIAEQMLLREATVGGATQSKVRDASAFLLHYVVDSISFRDEDSEKAFISRCIEVFGGFIGRLGYSAVPSASAKKVVKHHLDVLAFLALVLAAVHRLADSVRSLKFQVEGLLTKAAMLSIKNLLGYGLEDLRTLYGDLQHVSARECGIRSEHTAANSWVILIKVLENARIPRSSFWDVTQAVMVDSKTVSSSDARKLENAWRDMFTLLPLTEVDDFGVVKSGMRHAAPVEGWPVPQKLLKRVFELYSANPRQPPSFNEYCRALAARCHYLVQQWGWRKCSGIIGTWFDFFGSHNLAHLRNEEVFKSPKFLDDLAGHPSLAIDPEDRCFHIFIKVLALVIQRLKKLGLANDIRNLVARTLPNHNRQYLKEDTVHQRDLAALRNHHDLLCTLFWAAPPDLRPAVHLIEKLVAPASSHKEALLINLRAWSQLAQFVVSSDEGYAAFKPFLSWQNSIFQQLLHQYRTAAKDIKDQVDAMTGPAVSKEVVDSMVKKNRAVAMDILFVSVKASFEVLKLTASLKTATYVLNTNQLEQIFSLDFMSQGFDWAVANQAIDMLEHYISRVEKAAEEQYSSGAADPQDLEDAIMDVLDHRVAERFFKMARTMMSLPTLALGVSREQARCVERTVTLSARLACRLMDPRVTELAAYFTSKKYGLFPDLPLKLGSPYRKYLPLFVATLVKNNFLDLKTVGTSLFQLWMVSIVKPSQALGYENFLTDTLKQRRRFGLGQVALLPGVAPDYKSNLDMFACAIRHQREELGKADTVTRRQLRDEYRKILQSVMQKMKEDLKMLHSEAVDHKKFMNFVRRIIDLIKSHGADICPVDSFFTQPSVDYSPDMEDPQLHAAGIMGYGIRLGEGETRAIPQLFHYLHGNFKNALVHDKLDEECKILEKAMANAHVFSFVLTRALPAIIWATSKVYEVWPLLDVYLAALRNLLAGSVLSREIGEGHIEDATALLDVILTWFRTLRNANEAALTQIQLHVIVQLVDLATLVQPSLVVYACSQSGTDNQRVQRALSSFSSFAREAADYLDAEIQISDGARHLRISAMFQGVPDFTTGPVFQSGRELHPQVDGFANTIVSDVRNNWIVTSHRISLNTPGRGLGTPSTQSGLGTAYQFLDVDELWQKLRCLLADWMPSRVVAGRRRTGGMMPVEDMLF